MYGTSDELVQRLRASYTSILRTVATVQVDTQATPSSKGVSDEARVNEEDFVIEL